jgi:uncharacterized OB-fold protein
MLAQRELVPGVLAGTTDAPQLIGSECARCGTVAFPRQPSCPRCTSEEVRERLLGRRGTLWTWTVQCFEPKSPPYTGAEPFAPYGVGYVELPGEVRVEARLTESDPARLRIGMEMELTVIALGSGVTYAFRPA